MERGGDSGPATPDEAPLLGAGPVPGCGGDGPSTATVAAAAITAELIAAATPMPAIQTSC